MVAGCARASEIGAGRLAPRVLRLGDAGASRVENEPLNRMTDDAEVLKSGVALGGRHFCGAQLYFEVNFLTSASWQDGIVLRLTDFDFREIPYPVYLSGLALIQSNLVGAFTVTNTA